MKLNKVIIICLLLIICLSSCRHKEKTFDVKIVFLHHSTGSVIWKGTPVLNSPLSKIAGRFNSRFAEIIDKKALLPCLFEKYNGNKIFKSVCNYYI